MTDNKETKASLSFVINTFLALAIFIVGMVAGNLLTSSRAQGILTGNSSSANIDWTYVEKILQVINATHIEGIKTKEETTYAVVKGIVAGLEDTYSTYYTPEEAKEYLKQIDSNYLGIGVQLEKAKTGAVIKRVFKNSPAEKAGLEKNDLITKVDNKDIKGKEIDDIANLIRGKANTEVKLEIAKKATQQLISLSIIRGEIDLDNIEWEHLSGDVYVLRVYRFTEGEENGVAGDEAFINLWKKKVKELKERNPKGLIVDLRGNPGGFVTAVQYAVEEFLPSGKVIMSEEEKNKTREDYMDSREGVFENLPVVILTDENSASASEIFAAALQQNKRASVLGQPTLGKGVEQRMIRQEDGSLLLVVFRKWLTPEGKQINEESPVVPDVLIDYDILTEDKDVLEFAKNKLSD